MISINAEDKKSAKKQRTKIQESASQKRERVAEKQLATDFLLFRILAFDL
jgi:hypothetical protein